MVKLLTQDLSSSLGIVGDATISIPLLRGSGKHIVTEPLNQAERNVVYAIYDAIRSKRIIKETVGESGKTVKTVQFKVPKAPSTVKSKLTFCLDMMISFKSCHLFKST